MVANYIFQMLRFPDVDLFATGFSNEYPLHVSPVPDIQAFAIDTLSLNWNNLHAYTFPPTVLLLHILTKMHQSRCRIVLIAPLWPQRPCF